MGMFSDRFAKKPRKGSPDTAKTSRIGHVGGRGAQLKRQECQAKGGTWKDGKCVGG